MALFTAASMNFMCITPSCTFAYFDPSHSNALPPLYRRTSASKLRCSRAYASWNASMCPEGMVGSVPTHSGNLPRNESLPFTSPRQ